VIYKSPKADVVLSTNSMRPFAEYVVTLRAVVTEALTNAAPAGDARVVAALNGQPGRELRRLVPLETRRADGAFFTGSLLARRVVAQFLPTVPRDSVICDPACGAGDLLIAATNRLPIQPDLRATLRSWANVLRAYDIHEHFVEATRLRIVLAAIARGSRARGATPEDLTPLLSGIQVSDGLLGDFHDVDVILMNPPYGSRPAPPECSWASGLVSDAAVFTAQILRAIQPTTKLVAILPDVLRTGTRYRKWRREVEKGLNIAALNVVGIFDTWADVDVFTMQGDTRVVRDEQASPIAWWETHDARIRVGDSFDVHVGGVVPHRDPDLGPWRKYLHARTISNLEKFNVNGAPSRRFDRKTFRPPFVAVRRTSRPDDRQRAVGTIVVGDAEVAVENHLIVVSPHSRTLRDCDKLMQVLRHGTTTQWLNERIRCRHLTVGAIADIPWPNTDGATSSPIRD
jgi:hypothetical protein